MYDDDLERFALQGSQQHFRDDAGEASADNALLFSDAMLYMVAGVSILFALSHIWGDDLNPAKWAWADVDAVLLGAGVGLWVCSQSLNDFKRILPLWLKMMLRMKLGPSKFADQRPSARRRRAWTMMLAAGLALASAWRFSTPDLQVESRVGVPFEYVLAGVAVLMLLVGLHWLRLARRGPNVVNLHR